MAMTKPAQILYTLAALVAVLNGCVSSHQQTRSSTDYMSRVALVPVQPTIDITLIWESGIVTTNTRSANGWEVQESQDLLNWSVNQYVINYQTHSVTTVVHTTLSPWFCRLRAY